MKVADYWAELYVAGTFADSGWNVYFPHRERGFDFVVTKRAGHRQVIRPVQVKGKYTSDSKTDKAVYGYVGRLTELHPEMVLAISYYHNKAPQIPAYIAYMPASLVRPQSRGFRCEPAKYSRGWPRPRPAYRRFFDSSGLKLLEFESWKDLVCADEVDGA